MPLFVICQGVRQITLQFYLTLLVLWELDPNLSGLKAVGLETRLAFMWWIRREACLFGGSASFRLTQKIKATTIALRVWNKEVFGNIQNCLNRLYDNIAHVQGLPPSEQSWEAKLRLRADLLEMLHRDECLWKQKAKVTWLSTSDLNTHFFHLSTTIMRRRKNIEAIKIGDGVWFGSKLICLCWFQEVSR